MKTILWISRHEPLPAQLEVLEQKLGKFRLVKHSKPIATAEKAIELAKNVRADYIIPVLPLSFIIHLVSEAKKHGFTVLRAEMENIHNCKVQPCPEFDEFQDTIMESRDLGTGKTIYRHFRFREFRVLKKINIVSEKW